MCFPPTYDVFRFFLKAYHERYERQGMTVVHAHGELP